MPPLTVVRLKVCCIMSAFEADLAIGAGADALGFVSAMPSGPGPIPEALIAEIVPRVPPPIGTFLLTAQQSAAAVAAQHARCRTSAIQLCDRLPPGALGELRDRLPGVRLVQVVHLPGPGRGEPGVDEGERAIDEACEVAPHVDALLLDSGNRQGPVKELGGTGRTHDWSLSRRVVDSVGVPVFLAGGLSAENVREAIDTVGPFAVDVCSGVRAEGRLDPDKLLAFVRSVHEAGHA